MNKPDSSVVLAKSAPQFTTLPQHIEDGLLILSLLQKAFPGVNKISGLHPDFWKLLRLCIIFHDLGKTHKEFQKVLRDEIHNWNYQRHELFSLPFVDALPVDAVSKRFIKLIVAGHHKDFDKLYKKYIEGVYHIEDDDFGDSLIGSKENSQRTFEKVFNMEVNQSAAKAILASYNITLNPVQARPVHEFIRNYIKREKVTIKHPDYLSLLLMLGAFKYCDHMASAYVTDIPNLENHDFNFLKGFNFYPHQIACSAIKGSLILTAPTGSGKTESSMLWLQTQLQAFGKGRVYYILPFTASINAMYERLNTEDKGFSVIL